MKPVSPVIPDKDFEEIIVAEHQEQYLDLPALKISGGMGIVTRWKLSEEEKKIVAETGDIYLTMWTFGKPVTPVMLQVETPEFPTDVKVFQMNDCDWMAGVDPESCVMAFCENCGYTRESYEETYAEGGKFPRELTGEELDKLKITQVDEPGHPEMTFREALDAMIRNRVSFPQFFASTEY